MVAGIYIYACFFLLHLSNVFMQTARAWMCYSTTHETHQELGSHCCLALPEGKGLDAEGGWLNSLSVRLELHQQRLSSVEITHTHRDRQLIHFDVCFMLSLSHIVVLVL